MMLTESAVPWVDGSSNQMGWRSLALSLVISKPARSPIFIMRLASKVRTIFCTTVVQSRLYFGDASA